MHPDEATVRSRVAAGAAVLDALGQDWPDWRHRLNADRLDMADDQFNPNVPPDAPGGCGCVAAQWDYLCTGVPDGTGSFVRGLDLLANRMFTDSQEARRWAVGHGLFAETALPDFTHDDADRMQDHHDLVVAEYELLTRLWREQLEGVPAARG